MENSLERRIIVRIDLNVHNLEVKFFTTLVYCINRVAKLEFVEVVEDGRSVYGVVLVSRHNSTATVTRHGAVLPPTDVGEVVWRSHIAALG